MTVEEVSVEAAVSERVSPFSSVVPDELSAVVSVVVSAIVVST